MKRAKKLLIVNHDFPPAGGAGIKRCLKFMKYLPEYGWQLIVLTVRNGNHPIIDNSFLKEVRSDVTVYRSFTFETLFNKGTKDIKNRVGTIGSMNKSDRVSPRRWLEKAYDTYGKFIKVPDSRILWMPGAITIALKLVRKKQFDVIFATGPTFVNFILAALIKILSKKPLIIDFRDAWLSDPMLVNGAKKYLFKCHSILEKFVVNQADKVVTTNPFVTRDFRERYNSLNPHKFITIYNGYDIADFSSIKEYKHKHEDKFTIVYTGRLYAERTPKYFLKALQMALDQEPKMRSDVLIIFVGSCEGFLDGNCIEDYLEKYGLREVVQLTGHISRKESLEYQMRASILLLIIGIVPPEMELTYGLSGKVFDYMLCGKPILALANGGATRKFLVENRIGHIFSHEDLNSIKDYLIEAYHKFRNGEIEEKYDFAAYKKFDFRSLTKTLSNQLEDTMRDREA